MAIKASVLDKNGYPVGMDCILAGSVLPVMSIPYFDDLLIVEEKYAVPVRDGGIHRGYKYVSATSAPTPDSFVVTRVQDRITGDYYTLNATQANIEAASDGDTITPNTIPVVIVEEAACVDASGNYNWVWQAPTKTGSQEYKANVLVDGAQAVAPAAAGHASIALMVTWLNTNYAAAGTWSNPSGNIIKLVSTTNKKVGLTITVGDFA